MGAPVKKGFLRSDAFGSYIVAGFVLVAGGAGIYELFFKKKWQPITGSVNIPVGAAVAVGQANAQPATVGFVNTLAASGAFSSVIVSAPGAAVPPGFPSNDGLGNSAVRLVGVTKVAWPFVMSPGISAWMKPA